MCGRKGVFPGSQPPKRCPLRFDQAVFTGVPSVIMYRDARITTTAPEERIYLTVLYGHAHWIKYTTPTSPDAL